MVMYDNVHVTIENEIWTKDKIEPQPMYNSSQISWTPLGLAPSVWIRD